MIARMLRTRGPPQLAWPSGQPNQPHVGLPQDTVHLAADEAADLLLHCNETPVQSSELGVHQSRGHGLFAVVCVARPVAGGACESAAFLQPGQDLVILGIRAVNWIWLQCD